MPVYIIRAEHFCAVKIGYSIDVGARIRALQTSHPVPLSFVRVLDGGPGTERDLHARYAEHRLSGEWFNLPFDPATHDFGLADLPIPNIPGRKSDPISDIIAALGGNKGAASACGIGDTAVSMWRSNGIPPRHWPAIVRCGKGEITYEHLETAKPEPKGQAA